MPLQFSVGLEKTQPALIAAADFLPIQSNSIDLAIMPHTLEFSNNPHQILREVYRVLIPEGHIVISGFNPLSLWGISRYLKANRAEYPWNGNFIALLRLKDWLKLLDFETMGGQLCCYAPPFEQEKWRKRLSFMEAAGDRWWPIGGGVYFLHAIKHMHGMRVIKPGWKKNIDSKKRIVSVTHILN
jgi:SAM-dependent methyltransferase